MLTRILALFVLSCAAAASTGCLPSRIAIDLAPANAELDSTTVIRDEGAGFGSPAVALITIEGLISESPPPGLIAGSGNAVDRLVRQLDEAANDRSVKAVVLRIDSPGGTVAGSEIARDEVALFRERSRKPIVVSMGAVATSGGYFVSLAGDEVLAQESTITGSIGVVIQTVNVSDGLRRIGVVAPAVTSADNKTIANPLEPIDDEHYEILQELVDAFYDGFVERVLERRPELAATAASDNLFDGRVMTGEKAAAVGLVDGVGSVRDAYERAKALAGIDRARLIRYHRRGALERTAYASVDLEGASSAGAIGGGDINLIQLNIDEALLPRVGAYYVWAPGL